MIDREGRIVFGSLLLLVLILAVSIIAERQFGFVLHDRPLLSFLLFAGVAVAAPQLYLAATDDEVSRRSRLQFAAVATAVFATVFAGNADGLTYLVIATIGACSVLGIVTYELFLGYRASSEESPVQVR